MKGKVVKEKLAKLGAFINRNMGTIICLVLIVLMMTNVVSAAEGGEGGEGVDSPQKAEDLWASLTTLIQTWVTRLGGVVMFVGGVTFGLGWKSDDAEQKSRGISTLIAGAIVTAVAALAGTFFA